MWTAFLFCALVSPSGAVLLSAQGLALRSRPVWFSWLGGVGRTPTLSPSTSPDLLTATLTPSIFDEVVADHMSVNLISLSPDDTLKEAAIKLQTAHITGAPVVEDGRLIGVLSRTDLLYKLAGSRCLSLAGQGPRSVRYMANTARLQKVQAETVRDAMTPDPINLLPSTTMQDAAAIMIRRKLNRLFVSSEGGELLGVVSASDVVDLTLCIDDDSCGV